MTFANLRKQPWFWAVIIGLLVGIVLIYGGMKIGGYISKKRFDNRQAELLKKAQESEARADAWKSKADNAEFYAGKLKEELGKDRQTALSNAERYTDAFKKEQEDINKKYEQDKASIDNPDATVCERCRDTCRRSNQLAAYGPEFAYAKCEADTYCLDSCDSGPGPNGGP